MSTPNYHRGELTRWNRAGLRHFQYVDGNAASFLEELRLALLYRLTDSSGLPPGDQRDFAWWKGLARSLPTDPAERDELEALLRRYRQTLRWKALWRDLPEGPEQAHEERERLERQYEAAPGKDYAWEILRSFARSCHVVGAYLNAYANEGYLQTATQWDNLRRLVETLGYHPRPPASASTPLVLLAKKDKQGLVKTRFQVEHKRPQGEPPVVFETLEDIEVDGRLNDLRPRGWNRSPETFKPFDCDPSPWDPGEKPAVSSGEYAVLVQRPLGPDASENAQAVLLQRVAPGVLCLSSPQGDGNAAWVEGDTRLLLAPKKIMRARLNGTDVLTLDQEHGLAAGQVVGWLEGGSWVFDTVVEEEGPRLRLADGSRLPAGVIYQALLIAPRLFEDAGRPETRVPADTQAAVYRGAGGVLTALDLDHDFAPVLADAGAVLYLRLTADIDAAEISIARPSLPTAGAVRAVGEPSLPKVSFDGSPGRLASGDWVVGEGRDGASTQLYQTFQVEAVREWEDGFELILSPSGETAGGGEAAPEGLLDLLWRLEAVLDQDAFAEITLGELLSGRVADRSTVAIQGIGHPDLPGVSYAERLEAAGIMTLAELARLDPLQPVEGLSPVRLREARAKARMVLGAHIDPRSFQPWLGYSLAQLVAEPPKGTGEGTKGGDAEGEASLLVRLDRVYGPFDPKRTLLPRGYDRNRTPLSSSDGLLQARCPEREPSWLDLEVEAVPATLKRGRAILIEQEGVGAGAVHQAVVQEVGATCIKIAPPLPPGGPFTVRNAVVRANVVMAGHGAFKGEKVLGSGDATALHQEMLFQVAGVSFVQDPSMPAGVRADIDVEVGGQTWEQVGSLRDSGPADPHYRVRMTESRQLRIGFGDGRNGRRLPTGTNNVRISYRQGVGLAGNVSAGGLIEPVKPHKLIAAIRQPLPAVGGNDMEDVTSLREQAPASLLTLDRAVSLEDVSALAASQSGTWQARAFLRPVTAARTQWIDVVVVPAGGAELDADLYSVVPQETLDAQRDFLLAHAVPGLSIAVRAYGPVPFDADLTLQVKSAEYDPAEVVEAVHAQVRRAFALERRRLGQSLYRGELFREVESVTGVETSECRIRLRPGLKDRLRRVVPPLIKGDEIIRSLVPRKSQVIYLDERYSTLKIDVQEYRL